MRFLIQISIFICLCSSSDLSFSVLKSSRPQRQTTKAVSSSYPSIIDPSSLQQITDDLSILARLVNGISLHQGLSDGSSKSDDVIAELLNIESSDTVRETIGMTIDTNGISAKLDTFINDVGKLGSNPLTDSSEVKEEIEKLESIKSNADDLKSGTETVLGKSFIETIKKIVGAYEPFITLKDFEAIVQHLKLINSYENPTDNSKVIASYIDAFKKIKEKGASFRQAMEDFEKYKTHNVLKKFWEIKGKYTVLDPISKISKIGQWYQTNWKMLSSLSTKMSMLKKDSNVLIPLAKQNKLYSEISESLTTLIKLTNALFSSKQSAKALTEGFPNGPSDIALIRKDLEGSWLKENIADGKDVSKLSSMLELIEKLSELLLKPREELNSFGKTRKNTIDSTNGTASALKVLAEDGRVLSDNNNLDGSVQTLTGAMTGLQEIKGSPAFKKFDEVYDYVAFISNNVSNFENAFEEMDRIGYKDISDAIEKITLIAQTITEKTDVTNIEVNEAIEQMMKIDGFGNLVKLAEIAGEKLKPLLSNEFRALVKKKPDWNSIPSVQKSLQGTGLPEALGKLKNAKINLESINKMLSYGIKVREVQKSEIQLIKTLLTFIQNVKAGMKDAKDVAGAKPKARRNSDGELKVLDNSKSLSIDLGKGVNLLRKLLTVYTKKMLLTVAADYPNNVHRVIQSLPAMKTVWTDLNLKKLKEFPAEVEKLDKYAEEVKDKKDLLQVGSIFGKASEIQGVPIDNKLLKEQVVPTLQKSSDPDVKKSASTFSDLSELELDYSKHSVRFKAASLSLNSLREYFDEIFGIVRSPSAESQQIVEKEVKNGVSGETLLYAGLGTAVLVVVVAAIVYFCYKCQRDRKYYRRLNDPETWVLLSYTRENQPEKLGSGTCSLAYDYIVRDNYGAFVKCLKNGGYADAKVQSHKQANSLLHEAVLRDKPRFVEALIKAGATRETLNHDRKTPLELAKELKKKRCIKIFKKYEKRRFKVILPEPFPKHDYLIDVDRDIPLEEHYHSDFFKKFRQYQALQDKRPSHYVVKTDKDNVLHVKEHHLSMIFHPSMLMSHRWLKACLDNSSKISDNHEYRVTKMMFRKKIYNTVLEIKDFINRQNVPYLHGCGMSYKDHVKYKEWSLYHKLVPQLGIYDGTGEFPYMNYRHGHSFHRDDVARNIFLYRPEEEAEVQIAFKDVWIQNPDFAFMSTDDFIHFLLSFKIKSKKIKEIEYKNKKNGMIKPGGQKDKAKKKKKIEESNTSMSEPDSGALGTTSRTPTSRTPDSRTPRSTTPNSRSPGSYVQDSMTQNTPTSRTPGMTSRR
uniref:ANK_REP_REGION domain-containing protein n=1 Tax=Caenorhabditis tropicalis TaxID=1561998 RepID=A0A1I7UNS1_9PELO